MKNVAEDGALRPFEHEHLCDFVLRQGYDSFTSDSYEWTCLDLGKFCTETLIGNKYLHFIAKNSNKKF